MKYIDADKLIAELTKIQFELNAAYRKPQSDNIVRAISLEYDDVISLVTSLQQEQPCDTCTNDKGCVTCKDGDLWEGKEQPSEDLEKAALKYFDDEYVDACQEVREDMVDFFRAGAKWKKEQMMNELEGWKELAIRGMKKGATAYHQGKVALITDLEEWLMEDEK